VRTLLIALATAVICAVAPQAMAQDSDAIVRGTLSERLIDAMVRDNIEKVMEDVVEQVVTSHGNMTDEQAAWTRANVPEIMGRHLEVMIDQTEALYAEHFTEAELRAMVDFYETPQGRAIATKQNEVGAIQGQGMMAFMQAFVTDYRDKYCAAFTCPANAVTPSAAKH